jgi:hypothetical protein
VAVLGQRGHRHLGDVVGVDERDRRVARGQREDALEQRVAPERLAEVLHEPAAAHDRRLGAGRRERRLGALGLVLAAAGEQDEPADALAQRGLAERADDLGRPGHGDVGVERDVRGRRAAQRGAPRRAVVPVEGRGAGARADANGAAPRLEQLGHAATGLAGAADDERRWGVGGVEDMHGVHSPGAAADRP